MSPPSIPIETIARIFKEISFKHEDTRITMSTLEASAEYIKLFINEAIIRSNEARMDEMQEINKPSPILSNNQPKLQYPTMETIDDLNEDFPDDDEIDDTPTQEDKIELDSRHLSKIAGILVLDF